MIAPNVFITDHQHRVDSMIPIAEQGCEQRPVVIGDDVWIGTGAVILPGVTIGSGAVIGAGAIVNQDIPANQIWAGVPARMIRHRGGAGPPQPKKLSTVLNS
ncbi:acyltransferase [Planctomycetes bacterium SV_7m_r]